MEKWAVFSFICFSLLAFDLGFFHKKGKKLSFKKNLLISFFYIFVSFLFFVYVYLFYSPQKGYEFLTGYVIEKSLSIDNIFLIAMIFSFFKIPAAFQQRVLFWGILGAIVFRGILIFLGASIIHQFEWILYIFSFFLIGTGVKILIMGDAKPDFSNSKILKLVEKIIPIKKNLEGEKFLVPYHFQSNTFIKKYAATPLLLALIMVELTDVIFALDSVPAIFSITTDTYVVYTSNIFAILGLRSLYFVLQKMVDKFVYLKYSLAVLLVFIGSKIFVKDFLGVEKLDAKTVLFITFIILLGGILPSLSSKVRN